jgi:hypothetical protein
MWLSVLLQAMKTAIAQTAAGRLRPQLDDIKEE